MTLYLIHGNTWFEDYGYEEYVFGVYTTLAQAETAKTAAEKRLQKRLREDIEDDPDMYFGDPEWLLAYKTDYENCAKALSEEEAKNFLMQYDLEAYEKYFGELEEA